MKWRLVFSGFQRLGGGGGGGEHRSRTEGIKSLQHMWAVYPLTEAHVLLTRAATGLIWRWVSLLNGAEKQLCSLTVCAAPILRLKIRESRRRIGGAALPVPPSFFFFSSSHEPFSWLCERWCLFLLACPRRRWATDFTHFYWLIWLCSCQQLRVSQESEILRDSATATATVAALLWLRGAWRDQRRGGRLSPVS